MIGFEYKSKFWKYLLLFFLGIGVGFSSVKVWELTRANQENVQMIYASKGEVAGLKIRESIQSYLPIISTQLSYDVFLPLIFMPDSIRNGDFEAGSDNSWAEFSAKGSSIITRDTSPNFLVARTGDWLGWLGGRADETSSLSQRINISSGGATLYYWYYIGSTDACGNDFFRVKIDGQVIQNYDLCEDYYSIDWEFGMLDLSAYRGKSVDLMFEVTTNGMFNSNLALDDISFIDPR